jgi:NADH dehydrogenase (ubiquinone) 1 beta subcomplex subunit 3
MILLNFTIFFLFSFRNEVWRFDPAIAKISKRQRIMLSFFKGLPVGVGLFIATIAIEKALGIDWHNPRNLEEYKHEHGHH